MDFQFIVAVWGGVLSTMLAALRYVEFRRDRADILVSIEEGRRVYSPGVDYGDFAYTSITVANRGKRPITVDRAGLLLPRRSRLDFIHHVDYLRPKGSSEITEGKAMSFFVKEDDVPDYGFLRKKHKYVGCIIDATGRKYYSHGVFFRVWKLRRLAF
jgi:hypothetical protein